MTGFPCRQPTASPTSWRCCGRTARWNAGVQARLEHTKSQWSPMPRDRSAQGVGADREAIDAGRLQELRRLGGGDDDDVYVMLADLLLRELPEGIATMRGAVSRQDAVAVAREAHRLRGAAGNVGATALTALFLELEDLGRSGQIPGPEALARVDAEHQRYRDGVAALRGGSAAQ
jgi:HPt (histidine-containing phosphotransfer) domain-containing protein